MSHSNFSFDNASMAELNSVIGSSDFNRTLRRLATGDLAALETALRDEGIDNDQWAELVAAIERDKTAGYAGVVGQRVRHWLLTALNEVSVVSAPIITTEVMAYLGLPPGG